MACDPDLADTALFCEAYGVDPADSTNAILVAGKADHRPYALCLVLATCRLDVNGVVRKRLGTRKASFAGADETTELTGMLIGGVTPFGLPSPVSIWIDSQVMQRVSVVIGGGSRDRKIRLAPTGLLALSGAEVVEDLARSVTPN
jgi:prolyl-tRNA editing enzyme YbaK/EbsC (Cys-tRNA(Pro) deacylase)